MSGVDDAAAEADRRAVDLIDVERLERCAHAHYVDDRVKRADLVQLDVGWVDAMNGALDGS